MMEEYQYVYQIERSWRQERRREAMQKIANDAPVECAICGCPHISILQFGHPNRDARYHYSGEKLVAWILNTPLEKVLERIQIECPYCNTWHAIHREYPPLEKRPQWWFR